jgi:myo-inositol-1(or 4)-monophosphatase
VSDVDRGAEARARRARSAAFPGRRCSSGEESYDPGALGDALAFVVDPLDGTTNFLHGFPWYAVSIAAPSAASSRRRRAQRRHRRDVPRRRGGGAAATASRIAVSRIAIRRARSSARLPVQAGRAARRFLRQFAAVTRGTAASAAPAPRRSTSATSPAAASTRSGSSRSRRGTSPPASSSSARRAACAPT